MPGQCQQSREANSQREGGWAGEDTQRPWAQGLCRQDLTSLRSYRQAGRDLTPHVTSQICRSESQVGSLVSRLRVSWTKIKAWARWFPA